MRPKGPTLQTTCPKKVMATDIFVPRPQFSLLYESSVMMMICGGVAPPTATRKLALRSAAPVMKNVLKSPSTAFAGDCQGPPASTLEASTGWFSKRLLDQSIG